MAPSLRSSAKVPRRAAQLATARIEQPSIAHSSPRRRFHPQSSRDPSRQRVSSQPSTPQRQQKVSRPIGIACAQRIPKVTGDSHLKDTGDNVRDLTHSSTKKAQLQKTPPDRVSGEPAPEANAANHNEVADTANEKAKLQQSPGKASQKPDDHPKDTGDNVHDLVHSSTKEAKSQKSPPNRMSGKCAPESNTARNRDEVGNMAKLQQSPGKASQKPDSHLEDTGGNVCDLAHGSAKKVEFQTSPPNMLSGKPASESNTANRDEVGDTTNEKAKLQQSPGKVSQKPDSHLKDTGDNVRDLAHGSTKKVELQTSPPNRVSGKPASESDAANRDGVGDTANEKVKLQQSSRKMSQKPDSHLKDTGDNVRDLAHGSTKKMELQTSPSNRVLGKSASKSDAANRDKVGDTANEKARLQQSPGKASQKPMLRSSTGNPSEVDGPAHKWKVGLRKIPDRVLRKSVTKVNTKSSDNNDAACRKKANLQNSPGKVPRKLLLKSAAEKSGINDAACSKKAELHKSLTRVLREPVLKLEPENSNDPDDPACSLRETIHTSYHTALRAPVLNVEAEDLDNPPQSKKARLLRSADKVPKKLAFESDTEDSTDVDDPAHGKAKLRKSSTGIPWERVLESDTDDSDDFDDPTWGKKAKWLRSPNRVPRKTMLGSNAESSQSVQSRHPQEEKRRGSDRFAGKVGRDGISVKRERSEEENAQTIKGRKEALRPVTGSSDTTQQTERQADEPHYETRTLAPPFRKPDSKMRNTAYKCSVRGCPHANEEQSPVGLWLFPLPDEMDEALLRSEWLRHVPIDDNVNTPLSPRVCFKHFDTRKHFVSSKHRILGLKLDAVPTKSLQPLKTPRKGKLSNAFRRLPKLAQCASGTSLGQVSTSTIGVGQMPQSMTAAREVQKLQSTTCATMMQKPQSTASADIAEEARSITAGAAQESQPPTTSVMVQESKFVTSADVDVEPHSVTASGAAHESQSTTATGPTAMVQQSQSMIFTDVCSEPEAVETDGEPQKLQSTITATIAQESQSITSAEVAAETQSITAARVAQESESITSAADSSASEPVETDEEAQKSRSTATAINMQEPHSMTLTDVAAETQSMKAADVAQELQPTATFTVVQESQSVTSADVSSESQPVETDKEAWKSHSTITTTNTQEPVSMTLADVAAETRSMTTAGVAQELQCTSTATVVEESQSVTFDDVISQSQPVATDGEAQKLQSTISATILQEPQSITLAYIAAETQSMTAAVIPQESQSIAPANVVQESQSMTFASGGAESITATGAAQESESTAATGMELQCTTTAVVQELQSMMSGTIGAQSQFVTASGAAQELQPTAMRSQSICTAVVQKSQSMTFVDVSVKSAGAVQESQSRTTAAKLPAPEAMSFVHESVESQSVTEAGAAQESQSTTNATMVLEPQSPTLANVAAETESITVAGAAQDVQSTASSATELPSITTASMMKAPQSEALHDVAAEAQLMTAAPEAHESEFIADTAMELQSATTTSMGQETHCMTLADVTVESQSVTAAGTVQESQSTTSVAMVQEPQSMTLAKVAAETSSITAAGAAQELLSTASAATKFHSTTNASGMETPQLEAQFMTTAPEAQGSESTAAGAMGLQSTIAISMKQMPQSVTVADSDIEYDSMTAAGAAQELQSAVMEEPQFQALPNVPADTVSMTAALEARESESTAAAAAMVQEPNSLAVSDVITESKFVTAAGAAQEFHSTTVAGVELKPTATMAKEKELQPMIFPDRDADIQSRTATEGAQKPQSATVTATKPDLTTNSMGQEPQYELLAVIPESQSATAIDLGCESQSKSLAPAIAKMSHLTAQELQSTTTTDVRDELESTTVAANENKFQSMTCIEKREECEPMSVADRVQELQTATTVGVESESQCTNSISSVTGLAADSNSKPAAKFWLHFPDSDDESEAEEQNVADVPSSSAPVRTENLKEATECCPAVITEPIHEKDDRNTGTCKDLLLESPSEKCILKSASMQATSVSDKKLAEQAEEIASYLATHSPVDYVDESTVSICGSPTGSCDSDVVENLHKQVTSVPNEALVSLTRYISLANNKMSDTVSNKLLEFHLRTQPQASKGAVTSCPATETYSTNKPTDTNTERTVKRGMNVDIERDYPAPHHIGSHRGNASTSAIRTAVEKPPASGVRTKAPLLREVAVPSAAALTRSLGNLTNSRNRTTERNQRDSICERGLPHFSPQSCSSAQKGDRYFSSRAVSTPVAKATSNRYVRPTVSAEPSASCSEPTCTCHSDLPGRSSAVGAEKTESVKAPSAGHLFHPSQGRYILKKEVLQDGDELGMSAVLCTVVWVPTGSGAKT